MPSPFESLQSYRTNLMNSYFSNNGIVNAFEYTIPKVRDTVMGTKAAYDAIMDYSRQLYSIRDDDNDFENRMMLGKIVSSLMPGITPEQGAKFADEYMYRATGYRTDVKGHAEHLVNSFRSAGSSLLASFELFGLYANGSFNKYDEEWQDRKREKMRHIKTHAMNYNVDNRFNDNIFENAMTAAATMIPSMLPSIGISGIAAFISSATGGILAPTTLGFIQQFSNMSALSRIINLGAIGSRFATSAMMEGGSAMLELANAGADDDLIFRVGTTIGAINGTLENVVDFDLDLAAKPIRDIFSILGSKSAGKYMQTAIHDTVDSLGKKIFTSIGGEVPTEIMQEFSSMLGTNFAINVQKDRGRPLESLTGYTQEDFTNAFMETFKQTALGTGLISLGGGVLGLGSGFARSAFSGEINANKYTKVEGDNTRSIKTSDIVMRNVDSSNIKEDSFSDRIPPIEMVKVGNRYIVTDPSPMQAYAIKNSQQVYAHVKNMPTEAITRTPVTRETSDYMEAMSADTVVREIEKGIYNNKIAGFSFYDENMKVIDNIADASYASIVTTDNYNPVLVKLTTNNDVISAQEFETSVFGEELAEPTWTRTTVKDRRRNNKKNSKTNKTSASETSSRTSSETSSETDSESIDTTAETVTDSTRMEETEDIDAELSDDATTAEERRAAEVSESREQLSEEENRAADDFIYSFISQNVIDPEEPTQQTENTQSENPVDSMFMDEADIQQRTQEEPQNESEIFSDDVITEQDRMTDEERAKLREREASFERIRQARDRWDEVKKNITGENINNEIDVLSDYFKTIIDTTKASENPELQDAISRASAMIMTSFMKASGMSTSQYLDSLTAILRGENVPDISSDGKVFITNPRANSKKILGWFIDDEQIGRYINITENGNPVTLIHELGHHFLSVLSPDAAIYKAIANIYRKQFEADGNTFGTSLQEAFCKDLENYLMQRKTSNKELASTFERIVNLAKALWNNLKYTLNLTKKKIDMFDSIFNGNEDIAVNEQEELDLFDSVMNKADKSVTPSVSLVDSLVSDNTVTDETIASSIDEITKDSEQEASEAPVSNGETAITEDVSESVSMAEFTDDIVIEPEDESLDLESVTYSKDFFVPSVGEDYIFSPDQDANYKKKDSGAVNEFFSKKNSDNVEGFSLNNGKKKITLNTLLNNKSKEIADYDGYIYGYTNPYAKELKNDKPNLKIAYNKKEIFDYMSSLIGAPEGTLDWSFVEIYGDNNGRLFIKLKKEIRFNTDTEENVVVDAKIPRWISATLTEADQKYESIRTSISAMDVAYEWGLSDVFDTMTKKSKTGNRIISNEYASPVVAVTVLRNYEEFSKRRSEAEARASKGRPNAKGLPKMYFQTEDSDTVISDEELADISAKTIIDKLSDNEVYSIYKRFQNKQTEIEEKIGKEFDKNYPEKDYTNETLLNLREESRKLYISEAYSKEYGIPVKELNEKSMFRKFLSKNETINSQLNKVQNREMVEDRLFTLLEMGTKTYSANAKAISLALANKNYMNNAKAMINRMLNHARAAIENSAYSKFASYIGEKYLTGKASQAWYKIRKLGKSKDLAESVSKLKENITDEEWIEFFKQLIDTETGLPANISYDVNGNMRSFLIELSNFDYGYEQNKARVKYTESYEYAGEAYTEFSKSMLSRKEDGTVSEEIKVDDNANMAFLDLANAFQKVGIKLKNIFGKNSSANMVDAIVDGVDKKIAELNEKLEKAKEKNSVKSETIASLERELSANRRQINLLNKEISESKDIAYIKDLEDRVKLITDKNKSLTQQIKDIVAEKNTEIETLQRQIDFLANNMEYMNARGIKKSYDEYFEYFDKLLTYGNKRLNRDLQRIFDTLYSRSNKKVDLDTLFSSRFTEYNGILKAFMNDLIAIGVVSKEGEVLTPIRADMEMRKNVLVTGLRGMSLKQLSQFTDALRKARQAGKDLLSSQKAEREAIFNRNVEEAVSSIPRFADMTPDEIKQTIEDIKLNLHPGSIEYDEQGHGGNKLINYFISVEQAIKRFSPALHSIMFGGDTVDGKYNTNNLNKAYNDVATHIADRKGKIADKAADLFGLRNPKYFEASAERLFYSKKYNLGTISREDFEKSREISFGTIKINKTGSATIKLDDNLKTSSRKYKAIAEVMFKRIKPYIKKINNPLTPDSEVREAREKLNRVLGGVIVESNEYSMEQLMGIYLFSRQRGGAERLIIDPENLNVTNRFGINQVLWVIDQFENNPEFAPYREFADYVQSVIAERFDEISDVYFRMTGEVLNEEDFYFMLVSLYEDQQNQPLSTPDGRDKPINHSLENWFTKDRIGSKNALDLHIMGLVTHAIDAQETYIYLAEMFRDFKNTVSTNSDFYNAIADTYGRDGTAFLTTVNEWLNVQIDNATPGNTAINSLMSKLRRRYMTSVLMLNPTTILQQVPAALLTGRYTGMPDAMRYSVEFLSNKKEITEMIYRKSGQMRARRRLENEAYRADLRAMAKNPSKFKNFLVEKGFGEFADASNELIRKLVLKVMDAQNSIDNTVANMMFYAIYMHDKNTLERGNLTEAEFDQMCIDDATQKVMNANPSSNPKDNPLIYSSKDQAIRNSIMFTSQLNRQFNWIYNDFKEFMSDKNLDNIMELFKSIGYVSAVSLIAALITGTPFKDDDDEEGLGPMLWRLSLATTTEMSGMIPIAGPVVRDLITGVAYSEQSVAQDILSLISAIKKGDERREGQLANAFFRVAGDLGVVTGFPVNTTRKIYKAISEGNVFELMNSSWADAYESGNWLW